MTTIAASGSDPSAAASPEVFGAQVAQGAGDALAVGCPDAGLGIGAGGLGAAVEGGFHDGGVVVGQEARHLLSRVPEAIGPEAEVGEAAGFVVLGPMGPAPLLGQELDLGAAQGGEQRGEVLVVGRAGRSVRACWTCSKLRSPATNRARIRGRSSSAGRGPHPPAGGGAGHPAAVGEPVGHRQRPVGPVVVQGVGGQDHPERLVEQDVALREEAVEHDLTLVGRALLVVERLVGHGSPPGHVVSTVGDPQITPGSRRGRWPDYTRVIRAARGCSNDGNEAIR